MTLDPTDLERATTILTRIRADRDRLQALVAGDIGAAHALRRLTAGAAWGACRQEATSRDQRPPEAIVSAHFQALLELWREMTE